MQNMLAVEEGDGSEQRVEADVKAREGRQVEGEGKVEIRVEDGDGAENELDEEAKEGVVDCTGELRGCS